MNLDSLYAELTLPPKQKVALVVLDGVGDIAIKKHGYMTPLEAAPHPRTWTRSARIRRRAA